MTEQLVYKPILTSVHRLLATNKLFLTTIMTTSNKQKTSGREWLSSSRGRRAYLGPSSGALSIGPHLQCIALSLRVLSHQFARGNKHGMCNKSGYKDNPAHPSLLSGRAQRLPPLPQLQLDPENASTPESSAPPTPSSEISLNRAAKPPLHSYNGGMRGSAQEKKKFFELAIARQTQASPSPIRQEHRDKSKYQSNSAISESGTDISGYDSVAGDYCDRYTPTSSQDEYFYNNDNHSQADGAKTPIAFNHNQNDFGQALRASSTTPLAIRLTEDRQPPLPWENQPNNNAGCSSALMSDENGYGYPSIGQNMHDTSADSGVASLVGVPPPPPPPPGAVDTGKKWSIRVDENSSTKPAPIITSSVKTGKASGEVEVPRPQSVAELRAQIATKLEVRNPAGDSVSPIPLAQAPQASVVHQPPQAQHGRLTPSVSMLSLDRIQRGLDAYDLPEYPSTSRRNQFANEYSPTPSLPPFYGRDEPSKYSPNSATTEFPGDYYPTSSLKRQHSQLQLQPEVQHAVLLHPGYGNLNRSMQASVSMLDLSTPVEYAPPPASYHNPAYSVLKNDSHLTPSAIAEPSSPLGNNHLLQNNLNEQHDTTSRTFSPSYNGYNGVAENTPTLERDSAQIGVVSRDAPLSASISSSFSQEPAGNFDHETAYHGQFETTAEPKSPISPSIATNPAPKSFNTPNWDQEERPLDNTSDRALASESQADPPKSNRLAELIQLANESFGDDTGSSQLIDTLWTKTLNSVNNSAPPAGVLRRPRSALDLSNGTVMSGYSTLPARGARGTSVRPRNPADEEKSQWYRQISKEIHHAPTTDSERIITSVPYGDPLEQSMSNLRSTTPQARFDQQSTDFNPQQRRARSVGRYDAVADMEILDKFSQQRQQLNRELNEDEPSKERPRTGMEALQIACTSSSRQTQACPHQSSAASDDISDTARSANAYAISRSKTQHFHLPSYRFVHEDARPIPSPRNCFRCGKNRRDYTWNEIEHLYLMLDKDTLKKEALRESLGEKVKLRHIENRLQDTAQDLQKVIEQLEAYGKTRSKSNPEIAYKLRNCNGKFNYLVGHGRSGVNGQSRVDDVKKATMEEVLQRQRAEKLSEELDDQRSRRHGYFPGAAPALQNNVQRLDHLLQNTTQTTNGFDYTSSRCSTPARRANSQGPVQTCTVLYKFTAQTSRELSLNRGDVVRVHREIDNNWIEGERNGQIGIFPVSYVQMDEDPSTSRNRVRALYPFQARNRNELSLKKDEILRRRRDIDANWIEGTNSKGQIGIFPRCYVRDHTDVFENGIDDVQSVIPDRPKTPKIVTTSYSSRIALG
uniref:SH2 domain-containing protein n=1 Tax=Panagrellus redivivus TaxID=6233 RepID=A0A7E4VN78_PANRE